ncbi:uncharacterized protein LOC121651305 [Melanotaenia boesemani]|uniref:uncharacterized protein LOC121651305 n=1 Tax=Melanotaenia boesemani TaxID=1250792 RepID=UPI001C0470A0|nr:uncharacterized protein LOC121651305 [Melanotaenia boesemani]XP_041859342.1 uncharacterized protein LOC121651305 [Melanotaenia boesemani]
MHDCEPAGENVCNSEFVCLQGDGCGTDDVSVWLSVCEKAEDWNSFTLEPAVLYSPTVKAYRMDVQLEVSCQRSVQLISANMFPEEDLNHTCLSESELENIPALKAVPKSLWATSNYDVGLIKNCPPVVITPRSDYRPHQKQYPLKPEAVRGIIPVFSALQQAGIVKPCASSPCRSPMFPVKKVRDAGEPEEWRFCQDLQRVNSAVQPRAPSVPNPCTVLSQIPQDSSWYSVCDLSNAFFSIRIHEDSQFWFAFEFLGQTWTFSRLCQGFCESPTIFNAAMRESLSGLVLPPDTTLCQYMDDLLIASKTHEECEEATIALLKHLAEQGHKASLKKLQFVQQTVTFLGHVISAGSRAISSKRVSAIQNIPRPRTKKQLMSFLGTTSYCRNFIPNYSIMEAPLSALSHGKGLRPGDAISWNEDAERAFVDLKLALQTAPTLGLPDPEKPFVQAVDERNGSMTSVLLQTHGGKLRPVAYLSAKLDPVARGLPSCLRAVAAAEKAVLASRDIVGYSDLTLLVPHAVSMILLEQKTSHLSAARHLRYTSILLDMPNITVKRCTVLNPATLLPTEDDGEPHCCVAALEQTCTPRPDLKDTPLQNPDLVLYVDGSARRDPRTGVNKVGFAVCTDHSTVVSASLPSHFSAQTAELVALTEACRFGAGRRITVFTDSRYAFGVIHDFAALWKHRNFLKSDGKPILNATQISDLLQAVLLPSEIAVVKCQAHDSSSTAVARGNARADAAAKVAGDKPRLHTPVSSLNTCMSLSSLQSDPPPVSVPPPPHFLSPPVSLSSLLHGSSLLPPSLSGESPAPPPLACGAGPPAAVSPPDDLKALQSFATKPEIQLWEKSGSIFQDGVWLGPNGLPCLPKQFFWFYAKITHGRDHVSKGGMHLALSTHWYTRGFTTYVEKFCQKCMICAVNNPGCS